MTEIALITSKRVTESPSSALLSNFPPNFIILIAPNGKSKRIARKTKQTFRIKIPWMLVFEKLWHLFHFPQNKERVPAAKLVEKWNVLIVLSGSEVNNIVAWWGNKFGVCVMATKVDFSKQIGKIGIVVYQKISMLEVLQIWMHWCYVSKCWKFDFKSSTIWRKNVGQSQISSFSNSLHSCYEQFLDKLEPYRFFHTLEQRHHDQMNETPNCKAEWTASNCLLTPTFESTSWGRFPLIQIWIQKFSSHLPSL